MPNLQDLKAIKDSANVSLREKVSQKIALYSDGCAETSFDFKATTTYAKRKGTKAIGFNGEKEGELKLSMEVFELKCLPIILGGNFKAGDVYITKRQVKTVADAKITLKEDVATNSLQIFELNPTDKVSHVQEIKVSTDDSAVTPTTYKYDNSTKEITFDTSMNGKFVVCYYVPKTLPKGQNFVVKDNEFPINYEIEADTSTRNLIGDDEDFHYRLHNCRPQPNVSIAFSADNVAKLDMTFDIFPDEDHKMVTFSTLDGDVVEVD